MTVLPSFDFDFVVVGGGAAAAALAAGLSEEPRTSVLVLDASDGSAPSGGGAPLTEEEPQLRGRRLPIARPAADAALWVRGNRADYDGWRGLGNQDWAYRDVLPHFRRVESYPGGDPEFRGRSGPVLVADRRREATALSRSFVEAAVEEGFGGAQADYNGARQDGFPFYYQVSHSPLGCRRLADRPNLTVLRGARPTQLVLHRGRVGGVRYRHGPEHHTVRAGQETVLCAGALENPRLLMLSGIGPAAELELHGIPCVADLPGVGAGLQDHLVVPVRYRLLGGAPPVGCGAEAGLFTHTRFADPGGSPDLQLAFCPGAGAGFTFAATLLTPRSRGRVSLRDDSPDGPLRIEGRYLEHGVDLDALVEGIELAREIAAAPALKPFRGDELAPSAATASTVRLRRYARATAYSAGHPAGTCRMGTDPGAVVDARLRVRGVAGLRIADASVMPSIVAGSPAAAATMLGARAADLLTGADARKVPA